MPLHSFAILASSVASGAINVLGHVAETANAKSTSAKPAGKKSKTASDPASGADSFAAYLAALAASLSVAPSPAASTAKPSAQKGSPKSITGSAGPLPQSSTKTEQHPPGSLLTAMPTAAATLPTAQSSATPAATAKAKMPTAPTATVRTVPSASSSVLAHATPDSIQAARASAATKAASAATPDVPAKPLSQEGKDEIHLGTHRTVESPVPETTSPDHAMQQIPANHPVLESSDSSPPKPPQADEVSTLAGAKSDPVAAAPTHLTAAAPATSGVVPHLFTASASAATLAKSSVEPASRSLDAPASPHHGEAPPQTATDSSSAPGTSVTVPFTTPTAVAASQSSSVAAPASVPVADQLTRALVAQVDVVQHAGQTNFHLRLDPPQLGSVHIHLTATDHTVSARIVVAQEGTRQLLEGTAHHLRQGLADAGLSLGSFDVTSDGGGWRGGEQQAPPQTPFAPPTFVSTPRASTIVPTIVSRPTDGINILA